MTVILSYWDVFGLGVLVGIILMDSAGHIGSFLGKIVAGRIEKASR